MTKRVVLAIVLVAALSGCTQRIPNKVTEDEYAIYSAWVTSYFSKKPPANLYFSSRTGPSDPVDAPCRTELAKDGVSWSLIKQLHALGEAEFPLDFYAPPHMQISWAYKEVDMPPPGLPEGSFHWIGFSRVAFNRHHTEALFSYFDACFYGDCGQGRHVLARKINGKWNFRGVGCVEVS